MQQKHSLLPWKIVTMGNGKYGWIEDSTGEQVMGLGTLRYSINPEITAQFIVQACNSYYQNQETIKNLIEACKVAKHDIETEWDCCDLVRCVDELGAAISKAEKVNHE